MHRSTRRHPTQTPPVRGVGWAPLVAFTGLVLVASLLVGWAPSAGADDPAPGGEDPTVAGTPGIAGTARPVEARRAPRRLRLTVDSTRPDLVTAGDALVTVHLPRRVRASKVRLRLGRKSVTRQFKVRPDGSFRARLTGLRVGRNVLRARTVGKVGKRLGKRGRARLVIRNHPNGGPVFSGPQHRPYTCQKTARDAQCNEPARFTLLYRSNRPDRPGLHPYNPAKPPSDVATTTTDTGVRVPFVVRREDGYQARDRYTIITLYRPGRPWTPWRPQDTWNGKVLIPHGGNCGSSYGPGEPPLGDMAGTLDSLGPLAAATGLLGIQDSYLAALGRGFAVVSTALNNTGHNCNVAVEAESLVMVKERLVERYGPVRYTIGTGCSGGSIAQQTIANTYPGIYQGLVTSCSYPDVITAGAQFADYHLMRGYFEKPNRWGAGVLWNPVQVAAVEGHLSHLNAVVADEGLFKAALNPEHACPGTRAPVAGDRSTRFDSEKNPGGVRCSVLDIMANLLGRRPATASTWEKAAGRGFGGMPFANAGVLYGLKQFKAGVITPAMFLDLNAKLGGLDINSDRVPQRITGDAKAVTNAYRTGLVNRMENVSEVAMINHGGPDPGLAHDYAHAFWAQDRLVRSQGHARNRVMWFGLVPLVGDLTWPVEAFKQMDTWLTAVEKDRSSRPLADKIVANKPGSLKNRCLNIDPFGGIGCTSREVQLLQTNLSTPREQAGDDRYNDRLACRLTPLTRAVVRPKLDVPGVTALSDAQFAKLQRLFPRGVCDYSRPGQGVVPTRTWLGYGTATRVVEGGRELGPVPTGSGTSWMSPSFRELWRR